MAVERVVSEEKKKNAIDLIVMMVVDELAEDMDRPASVLLPEFLASRTGKLLYEEDSKLWWSGPSDIAEMFKREIRKQND